nr:hypothetical protein [Streptomyces sp. SID13726]
MLLSPFQVRAVRALEGYWERWRITAQLAGVCTEIQRRKWVALNARARQAPSNETVVRLSADAQRRLAMKPSPDVLLPTALGNALRTGEITAGERYGLDTLISWPRIYMQLPPRMHRTLQSARDALDSAANLCWSFLASALLSGVSFYDEPRVLWIPAAMLVVAALAYKGAVVAAQSYSSLMRVAYDLHRFDLLDALHHRLPDKANEREVFEQVTDSLAGEWIADLPYRHGSLRKSAVCDADRAADSQ